MQDYCKSKIPIEITSDYFFTRVLHIIYKFIQTHQYAPSYNGSFVAVNTYIGLSLSLIQMQEARLVFLTSPQEGGRNLPQG
jgi:hypothetical protein